MSKQSERGRLDVAMVERGLVESREMARRHIMAGEVEINGQVQIKPSAKVNNQDEIALRAKPRFVSRGGEKLAAALDRFGIDPSGWVCADIGASTGGFTDCMLQAGAAKVYAIDVGYGQLVWQLRQDPRVVVMERTNARYLESLPEPIDFASIDVSFISLQHIFPTLNRILREVGQAVALVKPQFEAGRGEVGKGGVVKDPDTHREVLMTVAEFANQHSIAVKGVIPSPLHGPAGNIEFLMWLSKQPDGGEQSLESWIEEAVREAHAQPPSGGSENKSA